MEYREFSLQKKSGGTRKICAPDEELLKAQQNKLKGMYKYYFAQIQDTEIGNVAHGFLPHRNVVSAAQQHIGFKCTIMMDISEFFDTVNVKMLPNHLQNEDILFHKDGYCAQGFATSPMCANISTIKMLKDIKRKLKKEFNEKFAFTIYADDIQISLQTTNKKIISSIIEDVTKIVKQNKFSINSKKTRIKYSKFGYRRILGVNVGDTEIRATRKVMRKIRAAKHQNNGSSLGGLINWSNCNLPKTREQNIAQAEKRKDKQKDYKKIIKQSRSFRERAIKTSINLGYAISRTSSGVSFGSGFADPLGLRS